jgi:outer membrane protein OmpA-like peptidoglycan-associated protein
MLISSMRLRRFSLVLGLAAGVSACSTISDLDPTGLLGGSSDSAPASQFPADQADQAPTASSDQAQGTTPDLASLPARPAAPSASDQQQAAQSLASDGAQARYSADALRGGTEAAAPPPTASDVAPTAAQRLLGTAPSSSSASDAPPPTAEAAPAPRAAPAPQQMAATPQLPEGAQPAPAVAAIRPAPANVQTAALAPSATAASPVGPSAMSAPEVAPASASQSATAPAPRREPAVPANTPVRAGAMAQSTLSDAALGFRPSAAPPLDPSVTDFVAAPIVARYHETASGTAVATASAAPAVPAVPSSSARRSGESGPVVANLNAISGAGASVAAMNGGVAPTAIVYFPGDGTALSAAAKAQVRSAAERFKTSGGEGAVRVVGHASSRTADMPVEKHLETIFDKSQARANAVAQELIKDGVPASKVLIDAVGDSQPIYYESMPQGEEGNRRAEIFVQG